jgi:hypothetical protein
MQSKQATSVSSSSETLRILSSSALRETRFLKRNSSWRFKTTLAAALVMAFAADARATAERITVFNVPAAGTGAGQGTVGLAINDVGESDGFYIDGSGQQHGFVRACDGFITPFDPPGSEFTFPAILNGEGALTGFFCDGNVVCHGFLRAPDGRITTFDAPGAGSTVGAGQGTFGIGYTDEGTTAGYFLDTNNVNHGFLRAPNGRITTFDVPGAGTAVGQGTMANNINAKGEVVGQYADGSNVNHGFLRAPNGHITTFDAPGAGTGSGQGTEPTGGGGVNSSGLIAGTLIDNNNVYHGFLRIPDGTFVTFEVPGAGRAAGQGTVIQDVNSLGVVIGQYFDGSNVFHGFERTPDGRITTFDAPAAGAAAGQGTDPQTVNDEGIGMGYFIDANNVLHGLLRK